jgi:hypothetical protein
MVTRITAEFEAPEFAEAALGRIRGSVRGVYSVSYAYDRASDRAEELSRGTRYTVLPAAAVSQNYLTAVLTSPASRDVIPEPRRSRRTKVYIVCDGSRTHEISSILTAMGGSSIDSPEQ